MWLTTTKANQRNADAALLLILPTALVVMAVDLAHAALHHYNYYWYESLLFSSFWCLFFPFFFLLSRLRKAPSLLLLPAVSVLHIFMFVVVVSSVSMLFFEQAYSFGRLLPKAMVEHGLVNFLVYGLFLFSANTRPAPGRENAPKAKKLVIKNGTDRTMIRLSEILYIKSAKPYIAIVTKDRSYLYNGALKTFLAKYAGNNFLRVHKSAIVNSSEVIAISSRKNGDYDLTLSNGVKIRASRNYRKYFHHLL